MTEEFLHYIWKFRLFNNQQLITNTGDEIHIVHPGTYNPDSGPDFFNSKIKIGDTLWAGNVEIHIHASDWKKHKHQHDKVYDTIILHVVYINDVPVCRANGEILPTLELRTLINEDRYNNYLKLKQSTDFIPCGRQIKMADSLVVSSCMDRMLVERLEKKAGYIILHLTRNRQNWEETFYQFLARNFGFKVNAEPFEQLARSLSSVFLSKHKNSLLQVEAMLFGQAGFLEAVFKDEYPLRLQREFRFLKQKFRLSPLPEQRWKFMRLRPSNFPTIRIAQFAQLIHRSSHLFSKIIESSRLENVIDLFSPAEASAYWHTHYTFDKPSRASKKKLGTQAINNIVINTLVPFLFVYGKQRGDQMFAERALDFLERTAAENNAVIKKWRSLSIPVSSAYQTQALLELKGEYCSRHRCLQCIIGNHLLLN